MDAEREFIADALTIQCITKAAACSFAGIKPSALSHWLSGKPSISPEKLAHVLSFIGLKATDGHFCFRENEELLAPRIWRVEDSVMPPAVRLLERARSQFGPIQFGLPQDMRGLAILFSRDGRFGAVQRCNPILLVGHRETAAHVGAGVTQRILDGDVYAFIEACRFLALAGQVDMDALEVADSIRQVRYEGDFSVGPESADPGKALLEWADVCAEAARAGLSPAQMRNVLRQFLALSVEERARFTVSAPLSSQKYSARSSPHSVGSS
jgi:transcriptional regulator with XRE-family HTH domain